MNGNAQKLIICLNFQRGVLRPLWHFPALLRFLFGTLLACLFQAPLSPQRAAQKLRRINKEISAMTKKQQADLDDSQPAERRCLFDVLPFSSNACSFTRECNADFYN